MATGSDIIGNVSEVIIVSKDGAGETVQTKLDSRFKINPNTTYSQVDTAARALNGLSSNTYNDVILVTNISVANILD